MRFLRLFLLPIVVIGIVSCTESKSTQCSRMNTVVNKISALQPPKDPQQWEQVAKQMEMIGGELKLLPLQDQVLLTSREKLVALVGEAARSAQELGKSLAKNDAAQRNKSIDQVENILKKEEPIVNAVNQYCGTL